MRAGYVARQLSADLELLSSSSAGLSARVWI
jgi:hypothetical protein